MRYIAFLFWFFLQFSTLHAQTFSLTLSQEQQETQLPYTQATSHVKLPILYSPEGLRFLCNQQDADLVSSQSFQINYTNPQTFLLLDKENKIDPTMKARILTKNDFHYHALALGAINTTSAKIYTQITCVKNPSKIQQRLKKEQEAEQEKQRLQKQQQEEEEKRKAQEEKEKQEREKQEKERKEKEQAEKKKKTEEPTPQSKRLQKYFGEINIKKTCPPADKLNVDALVKICARGFLNDQYRTTTSLLNQWDTQNGTPLWGRYCGYNRVTGELRDQSPWRTNGTNSIAVSTYRFEYKDEYTTFDVGKKTILKPGPRYPRYDFYGTYIFLVDLAPGIFVTCDDFSFDSQKQFITYSAVAINVLFDSDKIKFSEMISKMKDLPKQYADLKIFLDK